MKEWYRCTAGEVLEALRVTPQGMSEEQARERRQEYGENRIREPGRKSAFRVFLEQFEDLLVVILIGAAVISMLTDNVESTVVIFAVILLNAILGTVQHERAEKSLESLRALSSPTARVRRDGVRREIPSSEVVVGDILYLEAGDMVAADARVIRCTSLRVNESSLTGESGPVEKDIKPLPARVPLAERRSMVYSGSLVTAGVGTAVVTATGMDTEIGTIASLMDTAKEKKTPLQISLDQFSSRLAAAILVICLIVFGLSVYRNMTVLDSLLFAVALAVAAIPEALGSIVTIVQAMGTQKMAKENAIIKDLKAVESLGCVSVICTDKTGTLTQNRMKVEEVTVAGQRIPAGKLDPSVPVHSRFLEACTLVNDSEISPEQGERRENAANRSGGAGVGDATELALLELVRGCGLSPERIRARYPRIGEIPFDSERKMMSTLHRSGSERILFCKGGMDILLGKCTRIADNDGVRRMSRADRDFLFMQSAACSRRGLRVLAAAYRILPRDEKDIREDDLIFAGMAAMMDPPRPESVQAVADARRAGIRPVMITGDHKLTAAAVAEQIGILDRGRPQGEGVTTGAELDAMEEKELEDRLEDISVYARVTPRHKLRIVKAWQKKGNIVAMTGDGVNDAPALKQADIGVAMGQNGTEVSKDAADMILADDNFATIIKAVANGRNVYRNIRNAIQFLLSGNMAGILCVLYTTLLAFPLPFAPVHLLFINLLTDSLPAVAIGMEPAERGLLDLPPRNPGKGILTGRFLRDLLVQGGLIAFCTLCAYHIGLLGFPEVRPEIAGWNRISVCGNAAASTMAFATLTLARLFHGFNCRGSRSVLRLGLFANRYTVLAFLTGVFLLAAALFVPGLQSMFAVADLSVPQLCTVAFLAFFPTAVIQMWRIVREFCTVI